MIRLDSYARPTKYLHTLPVISKYPQNAFCMNEPSRAAIVESIDRFRIAFNTGNLEEIARYYTDDIVKFRQRGAARKQKRRDPPVSGNIS